MEMIEIGGYTRISKKKAMKLYEAGNTVHMTSCKMRPGSIWQPTVEVKNDGETEFNTVVNAFEYYNCDYGRGYYASFYVKGCPSLPA